MIKQHLKTVFCIGAWALVLMFIGGAFAHYYKLGPMTTVVLGFGIGIFTAYMVIGYLENE